MKGEKHYPRKPERISDKVWGKNVENFEVSKENVQREREEAHRFIESELRHRARILVLDVGQDAVKDVLAQINDRKITQLARDTQFGRGNIGNAEEFRHVMGFDEDETQVDVWKVFDKDRRLSDIPYPDAWIMTGGPAMPSELEPGHETENTEWMQRAVRAVNELKKAGVPGMAVCLGHQLWEHAQGARVGQLKPQREFGTVQLHKRPEADDLQLLYGFFDDQGKVQIGASHSESVITPPSRKEIQVVAFNSYTPYQAAAHPLREGQSVAEADAEDELVLSTQLHPEITPVLLHAIRQVRADTMTQEGLEPEKMVFSDTPEARRVWNNFLELVARRMKKRIK